MVLIAAAVSLLFESRPLVPLERLGARWWHHIAPLTHRLPANRIANSYLLGMLWGWLPCGMVYSILLVAALSGTAANGAATMLCFGIGTLPAVLSAGLASAQVLRLRSGPRLNVVFGLLLLGFGILTVVAPWAMPFQLHMNMAM